MAVGVTRTAPDAASGPKGKGIRVCEAAFAAAAAASDAALIAAIAASEAI